MNGRVAVTNRTKVALERAVVSNVKPYLKQRWKMITKRWQSELQDEMGLTMLTNSLTSASVSWLPMR